MKMVDLNAQIEAMGGVEYMLKVLAPTLHNADFIGGQEIKILERRMAEFAGMDHAVACASGTDALMLALMELERKGSVGVIAVPSFGFPAAAEVAVLLGNKLAFIDVCPEDGMMDPDQLWKFLKGSSSRRRIKAIIVMDMFGTPAKYDQLVPVAKEFGIPLICDAAQSFGAEWGAEGHVFKAAQFGDMTTTSFFPAKPLGCYGDGGMVFTKNEEQATVLRELRNHGMRVKYEHSRVGLNSRLDTLQAAVLLEKLEIFPDEIEKRNALAALFLTLLQESKLPLRPLIPPAHVKSTWACFSLVAQSYGDRERFRYRLEQAGIPHAIHYPKSLHEQSAYRSHTVYNDGCCPVSRALCGTIFQVPFHPYLTAPDLEKIVSALTG